MRRCLNPFNHIVPEAEPIHDKARVLHFDTFTANLLLPKSTIWFKGGPESSIIDDVSILITDVCVAAYPFPPSPTHHFARPYGYICFAQPERRRWIEQAYGTAVLKLPRAPSLS
ncbi:hypothetical protein PM082_001795 [Marasmius tenuissimus]|nr:hypothetical protein PM082_001795 [Marasmius tenuissimus]